MIPSRFYPLLLIAVSGTLVWASAGWWNERQAQQQDYADFSEAVTRLLNEKHQRNQALMAQNLDDMENDRVNIGINNSSVDFVDTMQAIDSLVQVVLSQPDEALTGTLARYQPDLDGLSRIDGHFIHPRPQTADYIHLDAPPLVLRSQLLNWEQAVLCYFKESVGYTGVFPGINHKLILVPEYGTWEVTEGNTFIATAHIRSKMATGKLSATVGKTTVLPDGSRSLSLPTKGMLPAGQSERVLPFTASLQKTTVFGRSYILDQSCSLKIIPQP